MTALITDAIGFITMVMIPIQVIKDLGIAASVGVGVIVLTNLVLLPVLMSYFGISNKAVERLRHRRAGRSRTTSWQLLSNFASPRVARRIDRAWPLIGFAIGIYGGRNLQIGDLDPGAPELHPDSRYNLDNQFITDNYATSSDVFVVMVETAEQECAQYNNLELVDRFIWHMQNVPGVSSAIGATEISKLVAAGYNEGNLKWATISRDQRLLGSTFDPIPGELVNTTLQHVAGRPVPQRPQGGNTAARGRCRTDIRTSRTSRTAFTLRWRLATPASRRPPTRKSPPRKTACCC